MVYDVHLEIFEGPLDLLLYLIKKNDLEIAEIPIAQITSEYLAYLDLMKELNLDIAGEFLVMASTLMQIKARMLLPAPEEETEEGPNPLEELKAKLLEYQKFKEVAQTLGQKEEYFNNVYYRPAPVFEKDDYVLNVSLFDLLDNFHNVFKELPSNVREIVYQVIPIEEKIREILDLMEGRDFILFNDILKLQTSKQALIVCFMAVLELIRLKQIVARQSKLFEEIRVYRIGMNATAVPEPEVAEEFPSDGPPAPTPKAEKAAPVEGTPEETPAAEEEANDTALEAPETVAEDTAAESEAEGEAIPEAVTEEPRETIEETTSDAVEQELPGENAGDALESENTIEENTNGRGEKTNDNGISTGQENN